MVRKEIRAHRIGLVGKLLLAAFLPGQIPLVAFLVAYRLGVSNPMLVAAVAIGGALGACICVFAILRIAEPVGQARRRLREIAQTFDPQAETDADDKDILNSLDRSILELQVAGLVDPLTGVGNRRACEQRLAQDLARANRTGAPFTIAFVDLDGLKRINDRDGHLAGDQSLVKLAATLRKHIREEDWIARWGGDEFVLSLWNADHNRAESVCERVLAALHNTPRKLTASVGIAQFEPGQAAEDLLDHADRALLASKKGGRSRASVFKWR